MKKKLLTLFLSGIIGSMMLFPVMADPGSGNGTQNITELDGTTKSCDVVVTMSATGTFTETYSVKLPLDMVTLTRYTNAGADKYEIAGKDNSGTDFTVQPVTDEGVYASGFQVQCKGEIFDNEAVYVKVGDLSLIRDEGTASERIVSNTVTSFINNGTVSDNSKVIFFANNNEALTSKPDTYHVDADASVYSPTSVPSVTFYVTESDFINGDEASAVKGIYSGKCCFTVGVTGDRDTDGNFVIPTP